MPTPNSRTVRVFLSSTFRDFTGERDLLVKTIFPELRRRCRERQVELVDVDLRWGITEEEAQQGKVLPICLAEIDRSRPYFIGFLGERYGWVPEAGQYDLSLLLEQPWLAENKYLGNKSVTELEILHGVLNNPAMEDRAFFYFRDPAWSEAQGGAYLCEGTDEKAKLEELKDRIRQSGFPVVENYASPEELAERVREDLWQLIDEAYPESEVPDALTRERMTHEAYGASRLGLYLGGEPYFAALDAAMAAEPFRPVLVRGQSGGGKSALLANWVSGWSERHPGTAIIVHHLGCGADAADPVRMVVRLMREISRLTGDEFKPESDPEKQLEQLPQWLGLASAWAQRTGRELLLVLDGLDKVSAYAHLRWFPGFLPPGVKLVASCLDGEILAAAKTRLDWRELEVEPFTHQEQLGFIGEYLGRYSKALTPGQSDTLLAHPLSGNPLFLLTVLEELRVFGVHEQLENRLRTLLSPPPGRLADQEPTVDDVFEHVLARVEADIGKNSVQSAMEALWGSRAGLCQDELLAISKLAPARWAQIQNALDESLFESSGRINFGHDYLRKAVEDRYELTGKKKLKLHRKLAEWFEDLSCDEGVDRRIAEELPWQWCKGASKGRLKKTITDSAVFELLYCYYKDELRKYWLFLKEDPTSAYKKAWNQWKRDAEEKSELVGAGYRLAEFLRQNGSSARFVSNLYHESKSHIGNFLQTESEEYKGGVQTAIKNSEGLFFVNQGKFKRAEGCFRKAFRQIERVVGRNHPDALDALNNLAQSLWRQNRLGDAEKICEETLSARVVLFGENHERTVSSLIMSGNVAHALRKSDAALAFYKRAITASTEVFGENSETTFGAIQNYANVLRDFKSPAAAEIQYRTALAGFQSVLGSRHPDSLAAGSALAKCLSDSGKKEEAEKILTKVLMGRQKVLGTNHPYTLESMHYLGVLRVDSGNIKSGESLQKKALKKRVFILGVSHPDSLQSVNQLGKWMESSGNYKAQEQIFEYYLRKTDRSLGPTNALSLQNVNYLACLKNKYGKRGDALKLLRKRATISRKARDAVAYNLACYECLEGNQEEAKRLIAEHLERHPENKAQALADEDFAAIRDWIATTA